MRGDAVHVQQLVCTHAQRERYRFGEALVGAGESHAWAEIFLPGGFWWPLDPTNACVAGERHVKVAVGRDYSDVAPASGTCQGPYPGELTTHKRAAVTRVEYLEPPRRPRVRRP